MPFCNYCNVLLENPDDEQFFIIDGETKYYCSPDCYYFDNKNY